MEARWLSEQKPEEAMRSNNLFLQRLLGRLYLAEQRFFLRQRARINGSARSIAVYHSSTHVHLALFLQQFLNDATDQTLHIYSRYSHDEICAQFPFFPAIKEGRSLTWNGNNTNPRVNVALLLTSNRQSVNTAEKTSMQLRFMRCTANEKIIVTGNGDLWRGGLQARMARKCAAMAFKAIRRAADARMESQIRGALHSPKESSNHKRLVSSFPVKMYQDSKTGSIHKPMLLDPQSQLDLYADGYHCGLYVDEMKDWSRELSDYQSRRWRNIMAVSDCEWLRRHTGERALDFGCGTGGLADKLSREGFHTTGVDVSEASIAIARKFLPHVSFQTLDEFDHGNQTCAYSLITLSHVLEHVAEPENLLRKLSELLASDGRLYVEVPLFSPAANRMRPHWYRQLDHHWEFTGRGLSDVVRRAGLEILSHKHSLNMSPPEPYQFLIAKKTAALTRGAG